MQVGRGTSDEPLGAHLVPKFARWYSPANSMTERLPRFSNPPVVEVALSVMLEPLTELRAAHIGLLWEQVRERFPKTADQPPVDSPIEVESEPRRHLSPTVQFQPFQTAPLRTWFLNERETELLQIQHDRVSRNWRRANTTEPYPSYENIRGPFQQDLQVVRAFVESNHLGELRPRQAEITYVNHIVAGHGWKDHSEVERVIKDWNPLDHRFLGAIEDATLSWRYLIRDRKGFRGRLHVSFQPAYRTIGDDDVKIFVLTITARGKPIGTGLDGALGFLELGHEWIVRGFADLTTPEMHQIWQRQH
jgi:uncharacterized protein (TIGR04255 family)